MPRTQRLPQLTGRAKHDNAEREEPRSKQSITLGGTPFLSGSDQLSLLLEAPSTALQDCACHFTHDVTREQFMA